MTKICGKEIKGPYKSSEDEAFKFCITSSHRWMPSDTLVTAVLLVSALLLVTFWKPENKKNTLSKLSCQLSRSQISALPQSIISGHSSRL